MATKPKQKEIQQNLIDAIIVADRDIRIKDCSCKNGCINEYEITQDVYKTLKQLNVPCFIRDNKFFINAQG